MSTPDLCLFDRQTYSKQALRASGVRRRVSDPATNATLPHSTSDHWTLFLIFKSFLACPEGIFYLDGACIFRSNSWAFFWRASGRFPFWCACFPRNDTRFFCLGVSVGHCRFSSFLHVPIHTSLSKYSKFNTPTTTTLLKFIAIKRKILQCWLSGTMLIFSEPS